MANFPTFSTNSAGTVRRWRDPKKISFSRANTVKGRMMSAARKSDFVLHLMLSGADYATLEAFYDANRAITFTYTWSRMVDGAVVSTDYTVIFGESNIDFPRMGAGGFECTINLINAL